MIGFIFCVKFGLWISIKFLKTIRNGLLKN